MIRQCNLHLVASQPQSSLTASLSTQSDLVGPDAGLSLRKYVAAAIDASDDGCSGHQEHSADRPKTSCKEDDTVIEAIARSMEDIDRQQNLHFDAIRCSRVDLVGQLLSRGADVDARGSDGITPLYCAINLRLDKVVKLLLDSSADIECVAKISRKGTQYEVASETPLLCAARQGLMGIVEMLLEAKANPNTSKMTTKRSPLREAISNGHRKTAEILIEGGADISASDWEDWTPLHYAVYYSNVDIT